jgi:hypothetical protein
MSECYVCLIAMGFNREWEWSRGEGTSWHRWLRRCATSSSRIRVSRKSLNSFNLTSLSSRSMALVFTQLLTEMNTRKSFSGYSGAGVLGWQLNRHLRTNYLGNVRSSTSHNPTGLHCLLQGQLYFIRIVRSRDSNLLSGMIYQRHVSSPVTTCPSWR